MHDKFYGADGTLTESISDAVVADIPQGRLLRVGLGLTGGRRILVLRPAQCDFRRSPEGFLLDRIGVPVKQIQSGDVELEILLVYHILDKSIGSVSQASKLVIGDFTDVTLLLLANSILLDRTRRKVQSTAVLRIFAFLLYVRIMASQYLFAACITLDHILPKISQTSDQRKLEAI